MSSKTTPAAACPMPIYASLTERLAAGRDAADVAWAAKASTSFRDVVGTLASTVRTFDVRAAEITDYESLLRMRSELAEALRGAAAAIAPRTI